MAGFFGEKSERESLSAKVIAGINVIKLENIFFKYFTLKQTKRSLNYQPPIIKSPIFPFSISVYLPQTKTLVSN